MLTSKLACGPMSKEVIEAVFRYSHQHKKQLMLICSRNQIDADSGYVFITQQYISYITQMKRKYPRSNVIICRDHCGPDFGTRQENDLSGTIKTIKCDLESGFDLIHIDLCRATMTHEDKLHHTAELMQFAIDIRSDIIFEIGTDENVGVAETNIDRIIADIRLCQQITNPEFYVVQTGSLVRGICNVGSFHIFGTGLLHDALHACGVKLKEHNADYLDSEELRYRRGIVDAVNVAPQLGVIQTNYVLSQALIYGIDTQSFIDEVVHGNKWIKWTGLSGNPQRMLLALVAGHYHFNGPAYKQLIDKLSQKIDIREGIISEVTKLIKHYLFTLGGK